MNSRGGGSSSNLGGGALLNFHICAAERALYIYNALSAAQKCILDWQYSERLTIPLTSSSIGSATFIVQNSNMNCGF